MGRKLFLLALLALLLTGCREQTPPAPETTQTAETEEILVTDVITNTAAPVWTLPEETAE